MSRGDPVEVCIIGAGVAGIVLASELVWRGIDVLLLEAGPRHDPARRYEYMRQNLHGTNPWASNNPRSDQFTLEGSSRYPLDALRVKAVGGSGLHWAAGASRLHESDFELRARYGIAVDWPIRYRELEPYYTDAEYLIGVAGADTHPWTPWRSNVYPMPPFPPSYSDQLLKPAFDRLGVPPTSDCPCRGSTTRRSATGNPGRSEPLRT